MADSRDFNVRNTAYIVKDMKERWATDPRWKNTKRLYTAEDVVNLRGSLPEEHTVAKHTAEKLWNLINTKPFVNALGALTGNQAMQMVKAGLEAIYCSGWQVAADANVDGQMYPDQSLYSVQSVPRLVESLNKTLRRADEIEWSEGKRDRDWFAPIVADAEAGFGGNLNAFELMKAMIKAGAACVHFEDQLSSAKKCGHLGGKVLVPGSEFVKKLVAARLASDVMGTPTLIIARTDANSARLLTSAIDNADYEFLKKHTMAEGQENETEVYETTSEGFYHITGGLDMAISRGLQYAPYADMLWCETSKPDLEEARKFAEGIRAVYPDQLLAYNCFSRDTEFVTNKGVKSFENFKDGDRTVVLSHTGQWQKAVVKSYGEQELNEIIFTKGNRNSVPQKVLATKNHRWLLTNGIETTDLKEGDKVLSAPSQEIFDFDNAEPFEKLYWCYGYVYGDGTRWKKNGEYKGTMVRLCNKDAHYAYRFEEVGFKTSTNQSLSGDFFAYTGSYMKTLPDITTDNINLIRAFVSGWLEADGAKVLNSNGKRYKSIQITGEKDIDFMTKTLPMCGFYITRIEDYTGQKTNFGIRNGITKRINISNNKSKHGTPWVVKNIKSNIKKDIVWCLEVENDKSFVFPNGIATGNCSPSFNWKKNLDDTTIAKFQRELAAMGFKFQFITLAGFHSLNNSMFELALGYKDRQMAAYSELQEREFANKAHGYTATEHQHEVGTSYFDKVAQTVSKEDSTLAMKGSTADQFDEH